MKCELYQFSPQVYPFNEGYERCLCDGREVKNVYVTGERLRMFM